MTVNLQTDEYKAWYEPELAVVKLQGYLRLPSLQAYQPLMNLLFDALAQSPQLTLDLRELEFLNSSGISMLSMFIVTVRNQGKVQLLLQGSNAVLWQTKSLRNLQRLMPDLHLEFS